MMDRISIKPAHALPPKELDWLFADPPLLGDESGEDYIKLRDHLIIEAQATTLPQWILLKDYVDLTYDILRERKAKVAIIELKTKEVVLNLLKSTYDGPDVEGEFYAILNAANDAQKWASNPEKRAEIDAVLTK